MVSFYNADGYHIFGYFTGDVISFPAIAVQGKQLSIRNGQPIEERPDEMGK